LKRPLQKLVKESTKIMAGKVAVALDTNIVVEHLRHPGKHEANLAACRPHLPATALAEHYAGAAKSVTLLHRRDVYQAAPEQVAQVQALSDAKLLQLMVGQVTGFDEQAGQLSAALVTGVDGQTQAVAADTLLVYLGLSPKLGPVADWGLAMARKQVAVDTEKFSTSVPGIFAVGDINTYPGKKKLILSGFHECALAAFGAADIVFPGKHPQLEYTTSSSRLHGLLGVVA